jgi:2-hydroxychromene-2-carboxylate isomerase
MDIQSRLCVDCASSNIAVAFRPVLIPGLCIKCGKKVPRKPYTKPKLKRYGALHDVTRAVGHISRNLDGGGGKSSKTA